MAAGFALGSAIVGIGSAIKNYKDLKKANKEAEALGFANYEAQIAETKESVRRTEEANEATEANISTDIAASGFAVGGSLDKYLESVQETHASDLDWMRTSGASRASIIERETIARAKAGKDAATGGLVSGIGSGIASGVGAFSAYEKYGWGF